jgi:hypothetical protein
MSDNEGRELGQQYAQGSGCSFQQLRCPSIGKQQGDEGKKKQLREAHREERVEQKQANYRG